MLVSIVFLKSNFLLQIFFILILFFLAIVSKKLIWLKSIFLSLLVLATGVWYVCDRLSGNGIDFSVFYHLTHNIKGVGVSEFLPEILCFVGTLIIALMCFLMPFFIRNSWVKRGWLVALLFLVAFSGAFFNTMFYRDISIMYERLNAADQSDLVSKEYIRDLPNLNNKKNIVLIYAESLERTYLNEAIFPNLMPQLNELAKESISFTQIDSALGGTWTIAGLVSSMCGTPLTVSGTDGNNMGSFAKFLPGAFCLASYLRNQGYATEFIGGANRNFAGKGKFLQDHGFDSIKSKSFFLKQLNKDSKHFSDWGVHDDKLLDEAFNSFIAYSEKKQPFLLTILTLDTHHPHGYISDTCMKNLSFGAYAQSRFLKAVYCADHLLTRFIKRIQQSPYYANTLIVLVSDHIAMPNDVTELLNSQKEPRKNLFLLFVKAQRGQKIDANGSTLDISATLLNFLDKSISKFGFGRSLLLPKNDGASLASAKGQSFAPYLDYGRSLWGNLSKQNSLRLKDNLIVIGKQRLQPPFIMIFDDNGQAKAIFFQKLHQVFHAYQDNEDLIYVKKCHTMSFDWCMLVKNKGMPPMILSQNELKQGIETIAALDF